ncbi:MAG TPA: NAD(P)H-dependent oxidoreductase [Trebonia sp.]|nr:NAD(P)H-dependent oxidoreductase [Trebonia sp.]
MLNCTLKPSLEPSNTEALADVVGEELTRRGADVERIRVVDIDIKPGVSTDQGEGDQWSDVHDKVLAAEILIIATPTWVGPPLARTARPRTDGCDDLGDRRPRPPGRIRPRRRCRGDRERGRRHHVISEISGGLGAIGYTIPPQVWTYWYLGPGPGPDYLDEQRGHDWPHSTGRAMAANLHHAATALARHPYDAPPR